MNAATLQVSVFVADPVTALARSATRGQRGQGTVEYVALITLVALVMLGVVSAMKSAQFTEGQQLGSLILKKIAQAVDKIHY
jgi:Flp pilus assembly pilin Flp